MDCRDCQIESDVDRSENDCQRSDGVGGGMIAKDFDCMIDCEKGNVNDERDGSVCPANGNGSASVVCKVMDSECGFSVPGHET